MVTFDNAIKIARNYLAIDDDPTTFIMDDKTIEFECGWFFFYQTTNLVEIAGIMVGLGGNAPIIVDRRDGSVHVTGTAYPHEKYIQDYIEKTKDKK